MECRWALLRARINCGPLICCRPWTNRCCKNRVPVIIFPCIPKERTTTKFYNTFAEIRGQMKMINCIHSINSLIIEDLFQFDRGDLQREWFQGTRMNGLSNINCWESWELSFLCTGMLIFVNRASWFGTIEDKDSWDVILCVHFRGPAHCVGVYWAYCHKIRMIGIPFIDPLSDVCDNEAVGTIWHHQSLCYGRNTVP